LWAAAQAAAVTFRSGTGEHMELEQLKQSLTDASDHHAIMNEFMRTLGIDPKFAARGLPIVHPFLTMIVEDAAREFVGLARPIEPQVFTYFENEGFMHGGFRFGMHIAALIYFEDIGQGLLSLTPERGHSFVHFVPFRAGMPKPQTNPSRN
jgi:hypothetical protein